MTFVRLIASRSYCHWPHALRHQSCLGLIPLYLHRSLSASRSFRQADQQDGRSAGSRIRFLEQTDNGRFSEQSPSEDETAMLKARIEELEKEVRQYADRAGLQDADPNEAFGDIFDRMPEHLRPLRITEEELKALIRKGDPRAMDFEGAKELAQAMANGEDGKYDLDKVLRRLPENMRSKVSRKQLHKMLEEDDPLIRPYLFEEVEYHVDGTYDRLPTELKEVLTRQQVRTMIETEDPSIENYLCKIDRGYDLNEVYNNLPEEKQALWDKRKVEEMIADDNPAIREYFQQHVSSSSAEDISLQDVIGRAHEEIAREDGTPDEDNLHVGIPEHVKVHLNSFNKHLRDVASQSKDTKSIGLLWAKYEVCKALVPGFLEEIPAQVWEILWQSQWIGNSVPESRKNHLWTLVKDMVEVDRALSHDQRLVYIEYEFSEGSTTEAMKIWRSEYDVMEKDHPKRDDYRDLGVRLHVEVGQLEKAQDLIFGKQWRSNIRASDVAVLVAAKASKNDETNLKMAWSLYLDMRERLGSKIQIQDYDQIAMTFLGANKSNLALAVFKDMVLSAGPQPQNPETQARCLALLQQLQNQATSKDELDRISLESLTSIPKQLENKYFYASWLKRLIGLGEVDSTVQVLELMFQRGIRPDARHLNGIIGAWLRGQDKNKHQLALQLAWSMVNQRLRFVARRKNAVAGNVTAVDSVESGKLVPPYISKNLPSANVETFCLLLLYYQRRSMTQSMENLTNFMKEAEITPNSFFMNHLIFAELRKQNVAKAWKIYDTGSRQISPDLETFTALWNCEKVFTAGRSSEAPEFPRSRRLFQIMSQWFQKLEGRRLQETRDSFTTEIYNEIIRCFCFQKDIEGTIVALYGLKDMFSTYPNSETERLVLIQLSRVGEGPVARSKRGRARNRFSANPSSMQDFEKIKKVAHLVKEMRIQTLKDNGIDDSTLKGNQRKEEDLWRLAEVLRISLRHSAGMAMDEICPQEEQIRSLAEEMGVSGVSTTPPQHLHND